MAARIVIEQVDLTLSAGQRTALGLGPIGTDPRDAALRYTLVVSEATREFCVGSTFFYAWQRSAMTRAQLRAAVLADASARVDAHRNATEAEGFGVGAVLQLE